MKEAKKQFLERGYISTSMESIAANVGTTKGTLYARFPDKSALLLAICKETAQNVYQLDLGQIDETLTLREALARQAKAILTAATNPEAKQLYRLVSADGTGPSSFASGSIVVWDYWVEQTAKFFERRIAADRLALKDPYRAAEVFNRMVMSYVHLPTVHFLPFPDVSELEPRIQDMILVFLGGIGRLEIESE